MIELTQKERKELQSRFSGGVVLNEDEQSDLIIHTLSTGRIVKGVVVDNTLIISSISDFLCG